MECLEFQSFLYFFEMFEVSFVKEQIFSDIAIYLGEWEY